MLPLRLDGVRQVQLLPLVRQRTSTRRATQRRSRSRRPGASGWTRGATGAAAGGCSTPCRHCPWCGRAQSWNEDDLFEGECPHCTRGVDDWMNACPWCGNDATGRDLIPRALTRVRRLLLVSRIRDWGYRVLLRPGISGVDPRYPKIVEIEQRYVVGKQRRDEIPWTMLVGLLTHELGHSFLYHHWEWTRHKRFIRAFGEVDKAYRGMDNTWVYFQRRRVAIAPRDHVSAYAAKHPQEDFAETFRFYVTRRGRLRDLFAEFGQKRKGVILYEKFLVLARFRAGTARVGMRSRARERAEGAPALRPDRAVASEAPPSARCASNVLPTRHPPAAQRRCRRCGGGPAGRVRAPSRPCAILNARSARKRPEGPPPHRSRPTRYPAGRRAASTAIAALRPLIPMTLPPGYVPAPQRNTPGIGVRAVSRRSHMYWRQDLALEDVAAGEADPPLDVGRAEHLEVDDRAQAGCCRSGRSTPPPLRPTSSRRVSQSPSRNRFGTYWANTLSVCTPVGATRRVEHASGGRARSRSAAARQPSLARPVVVAPLVLARAACSPGRCGAAPGAGPRREIGQLGERHVHLDGDAVDRDSRAPARPRPGSAPPSSSASVTPRVGVGDDDRRARIRSPEPARRPRPAGSARPARPRPPPRPPRARCRTGGTTPSPCRPRRSPRCRACPSIRPEAWWK